MKLFVSVITTVDWLRHRYCCITVIFQDRT